MMPHRALTHRAHPDSILVGYPPVVAMWRRGSSRVTAD
jgi:hypothetical protein